MADVTLSRISGGGSIPRLAQDLNFASTRVSGYTHRELSGINAAGTLTTALSLTGKWCISMIQISKVKSNNLSRVKLTVDGLIVWDSAITTNVADDVPLVGIITNGVAQSESYMCNESFILELQTISDTNLSLIYLARPVL